MKNILIILFAFLSGCATLPKNPEFTVKSGDTIGILVDIPENLTQTFIGTTIFNNFEKSYPFTWNLETYAYEAIKQSLEKSGYKVIDLQKANISHKELKELLVAKEKQWIINSKNKDTFKTLQNLGVKSVIYLNTEKTVAYIQCTMSSCADFYTKSYGLFTRSFLGIKSHMAVAAFDNSIIITNPLAKVNFTDPKSFPLKKFKPTDIKNLTEKEWSPIKDKIINYIDEFSANLPKLLINNQTKTK